jgi:hypothetical protein
VAVEAAIFLHLTELLVVLVGQVEEAVTVLEQEVLEILLVQVHHRGIMGAQLML